MNGNGSTLPVTSLRTISSNNSIASHSTPTNGIISAKGHKESVYALAMNDSGTLLVSGGTEKVCTAVMDGFMVLTLPICSFSLTG